MNEQNKEKTCWFVRLGEMGQHDNDALNKNVITIDFGIRNDPKKFKGKDHQAIRDLIEVQFPSLTNPMLAKIASPINTFVNSMKKEDIVVCPFRTLGGQIYIGKIVGECRQNEQGLLIHDVEWINKEPLSRDIFPMDLLNTFTTWLTVFKIDRDNASKRFQDIASSQNSAFKKSTSKYDLEVIANNEIDGRFLQRFSSIGLENLVNAILRAKGYKTLLSSSATREGIFEIIVGCGEWGFDSPRIIVWVSSEGNDISLENSVFTDLAKAVDNCDADYGLYVTWGNALREIYYQEKNQFFKIRLWDINIIKEEFFKVYDKLPHGIQKDLPLKKIWIIDHNLEDEKLKNKDLNSDSS